MISRIRDGILYPTEILKYAKDHMFFVVLYILFFTLLMGTRTIIEVAQFDGVSASFKESVSEELETFEGNCVIRDASVTCDDAELYYLFNAQLFTVYVTEEYNEGINDIEGNVLYLEGDTLYLRASFFLFQNKLIELPDSLHNIDFTDNPEVVEEALFTGLDEFTTETKLFWGLGIFIVEFILNSLMLVGFVLISAIFLNRRFSVIRFRDCFALSAYASTIIFVILTFFSLIEVSFLVLIILIIVAYRQNGVMIGEIERRLKKPLDKQ